MNFQERQIVVNNIQTNYKIAGEGQPFLLLHGWGSSSDSWKKVIEELGDKGFQIIVPDLPGFGKTPPPPKAGAAQEVWGVQEYADFVFRFTEALHLEKFILVGHSFGGQTAVQFAVSHPERIEKLILISPAAVRRGLSFKEKALKYTAKTLSFFVYWLPFQDLKNNLRNSFYMAIRRRDYVKAQGVMKDVFQKVTQQDLQHLFPNIKTSTLIIWGNKDKLTPVEDAYLMQEKIPGAKLETMKNHGHNLHFEAPEELSREIMRFLKA